MNYNHLRVKMDEGVKMFGQDVPRDEIDSGHYVPFTGVVLEQGPQAEVPEPKDKRFKYVYSDRPGPLPDLVGKYVALDYHTESRILEGEGVITNELVIGYMDDGVLIPVNGNALCRPISDELWELHDGRVFTQTKPAPYLFNQALKTIHEYPYIVPMKYVNNFVSLP